MNKLLGGTYVSGNKIIHGPYSYVGNIEWRRLTTPISRESSGTPVLNSRGEVIGVSAHRGGTSGENGNFAITLKTLKSCLQHDEWMEKLKNDIEKIENKQ